MRARITGGFFLYGTIKNRQIKVFIIHFKALIEKQVFGVRKE